MHTDTPHTPGAPSIATERHAIRTAIRAIDSRWRTNPSDLAPGEARDRLLAPLLACATRVAGPGAAGHMHGVGMVAEAVAVAAGWAPEAAADLWIHAALHDLGKLGVSPDILGKPGPLTARERQSVEHHPTIGRRLLGGTTAPLLQTAARVAGEHHECWDGSGYPRGLAGEAIHQAARVIAIADVFDALTSTRPYRGPLSEQAALRIMEQGRGTRFDEGLFDAFLSVYFGGAPAFGEAAA